MKHKIFEEMTSQKNYCSTHHFYYVGSVCPFCEKDRIERLAESYGTKHNKAVKETKDRNREIDKEDLAMLVNKFNVK